MPAGRGPRGGWPRGTTAAAPADPPPRLVTDDHDAQLARASEERLPVRSRRQQPCGTGRRRRAPRPRRGRGDGAGIRRRVRRRPHRGRVPQRAPPRRDPRRSPRVRRSGGPSSTASSPPSSAETLHAAAVADDHHAPPPLSVASRDDGRTLPATRESASPATGERGLSRSPDHDVADADDAGGHASHGQPATIVRAIPEASRRARTARRAPAAPGVTRPPALHAASTPSRRRRTPVPVAPGEARR
jgi:hypothetical protein